MTVPLTRGFIENVPPTGDGLCLSPEGGAIRIYPRSPQPCGESLLFLFRSRDGRRLGCISPSRSKRPDGMESRSAATLSDGSRWMTGPLSPENAAFLRSVLAFTSPTRIGSSRSFGLGDRLGLAGPAHLRAIRGTGLFPVLAQQSIRELERTSRTAQEVMDCATFAAFQEGLTTGFAADGDHLKTTGDIDRVLAAGFTFFTFDPGDHVDNDADHLEEAELSRRLDALPWDHLETSRDAILSEYADRPFRLSDGSSLAGTRGDVQRAAVKYGRVLAHLRSMFEHLSRHSSKDAYQVEISVDETEAVTTPFEHFLLMSELDRLGIQVDSVAPRFVGRFEKGVDFRGDLGEFESQFARHVAVRDTFGGYRLSLHSGSDKFSIYPAFARLGGERIHVKTAGTSYLEALRALVRIDPALFREIYECSRAHYSAARASYHVSADLSFVPATPSEDPAMCDERLRTDDDLRQVLHVAFGDVLTARTAGGALRFKGRLLDALDSHEDIHFRCLEEHFSRHFEPFRKVE
jgi:tagaturonate epimerase